MKPRVTASLDGTAHAAWHGADADRVTTSAPLMRGNAAKRACDVGASLVGLVVLSPVFLVCAVLAKAQSRGSVFFLGYRVGRHGKPFRLVKFRTMVVDAPQLGTAITTADDPRVTRVGRMLRRSKLDELPNLVNVLAGSMSLVGPRPESADHVALYSDDDQRVLTVRPGMTGPTQIRFADEEQMLAAQDDPDAYYTSVLLPTKIASDLNYVDTRTFWRDIGYITATASLVLRRAVRGPRKSEETHTDGGS
ncbi:sugar transferase [Candidatus Poribacteria bacterium]|jgi:lipopolysaccharide/colanic/teichoic acid biosynthesis glycosyltransferase|nr:sugar transferase [Candidatus Poribacteria bacterium]MBT5536290.1 sugar transferase [Candidatus Poribacteria bacterium]MBT7101429.1 sugar transferase [Candidatus Poribacteria bacterium]MBT7808759.1 sugar transferase [Candidatus Poribacteria bacterium]